MRKLAAGGFGVVWEGRYTILGQERRVAIKLLHARAGLDPANTVRFRAEVKTLCQLDDAHICKVVDGGIDSESGELFLVMEYADGGSLRSKLDETPERRIDSDTATRWLEQAARGLLAAERNRDSHGKPAPVYHRDVKPENLLLQQGRVVVADFGAAKLGGDNPGVTSEITPALWTPAYGSPEQQMGLVDHRSDIYSLGATFFHLLTGQSTQARLDDPEARFRIAHDPCAVAPLVPKRLGAIVRRMTEPDPQHRYQSFADVLDDLEALRTAPEARWPLRVLVGIVAALLVVGGLEVTGVISLTRAPIVLDPGAATLAEQIERSERLQAFVRELGDADWELLGDLQQDVAAVAASVDNNQAQIARFVELLSPDQRPRLPDGFAPGRDLEARLASLRRDLDEHGPVRDDLRALRSDVERGTGTVAARERLVELRRRVGGLRRGAELLAATGGLERRVAEIENERDQAVRALARDLREGAFDGLAPRAQDLAARLGALSEFVLEGRARRIAVDASSATELLARVPSWPPDRNEDPLDLLDDLDAAVRGLAEMSAGVESEDLRRWLAHRAAACHRQWAQLLLRAIAEHVAKLQNEIRDFDRRAAPPPAERAARAALERDRVALVERRLALLDRAAVLRDFAVRLGSMELRGLAPAIEPPVMLGAADTGDLSTYVEALAEPDLDIDPDAAPVELREAAAQLESAADALRALVDEVSRRLPTQRDWEQLARLLAAVDDARLALATARDALDRYRSAEARLDRQSSATTRAACRADVASERFPALDERRRHLLQRVEQLADERRAAVEVVEKALRDGSADAGAVRAAAAAIRDRLAECGEIGLAERAAAVAAAAELAAVITVPQRAPATTPAEHLDALLAALADLQALQVDGDPLLQQWWAARRAALLAAWSEDGLIRLMELRAAVEAVAAQAPATAGQARAAAEREVVEFAARCDRLREAARALGSRQLLEAKALWQTVPQLPPLAAQPITETSLPEGWPDAAFAAPPGVRSLPIRAEDAECQRLFGADFLAVAEPQGLRLWFFDGRRDNDDRPVYMVFAANAARTAAALIDVHPVTLGEMNRHPGFLQAFAYWRAEWNLRPPDLATMAWNTSRVMAQRFAGDVADAVAARGGERPAFGLPADDYRAWPAARPLAAFAATTTPGTYPIVASGCIDVTAGGLCHLRSGVREWTETATVGTSCIDPPAVDSPRRRDTGFRLAIPLSRRGG